MSDGQTVVSVTQPEMCAIMLLAADCQMLGIPGYGTDSARFDRGVRAILGERAPAYLSAFHLQVAQ